MRIIITFIWINVCLLFCPEYVYAQKKAPRLAGEARYHIYADNKGKELLVPIDSVHYGYTGNRETEVKYAYNNTIDTDKYPEMAYLPDPGFFDIYPSNYDTAIKLDNLPDTTSFLPKWRISYFELNEYNSNNYPVKKTDLLNKGCSVYRRDNQNRLVNNYMYMYNKASDSVSEAGFIQYTYDNSGKMASREFIPINVTDLSNPILYNYDSRGRITEVRSRSRNVAFTYDSSKKTKVINMEIAETENVAEPKISVRCSYVYDHGNVVLYKEEKYEKSQSEWETIAADTITYDEQHHVTSFKDGRTGLYHNYKIRYNTLGQPVMRTANETNTDDTRTLPDGSVGTLSKIECKYYYETYVPAKQ